MNDQEATDCMALLVAAGSGWTDDTVDAVIDLMCQRWSNPDAARTAVTQVADTWQGMGRPPWGTLHTAYQTAVRHQAMNAPQLGTGSAGRVLTPAEGRQVAARRYAHVCESRDPDTDPHIRSGWRTNEPNQRHFDRMLGITGDA